MKGYPAPQQDVAQSFFDPRDLLAQASVDGRLVNVLVGMIGDAAPEQDKVQLHSDARDSPAQASVDDPIVGVVVGVKGDAAFGPLAKTPRPDSPAEFVIRGFRGADRRAEQRKLCAAMLDRNDIVQVRSDARDLLAKARVDVPMVGAEAGVK